jgi:hypothetical protein
MLSKRNSPSRKGDAVDEADITKEEGAVTEILIPVEDTNNNN